MAQHRESGSRDGRGAHALSASLMVLVVAPDYRRCGELVGALQSRGILAVQARDRDEAFCWSSFVSPALVVLDLRTKHSTALLDRFRREQRSVIALSDDSHARRSALEAGCLDADHVSQHADELALKIKAVLRTRPIKRIGGSIDGPLTADRSTGHLRWFDQELKVSAHLFELASYLIDRNGEFVPTVVLLRDLWGEAWASPDRVHKSVWRLRRQLGLRAGSGYLVARRGYGYGIFPVGVKQDSIVVPGIASKVRTSASWDSSMQGQYGIATGNP